MGKEWIPGVTEDQVREALQRSCDEQERLLREAVIGDTHEPPKEFRPEHLKRMGVTIVKGEEV